MKHKAIDQVLERAESAKTDSDFTHFFSMLLAAEALAKTVVLGMIAAIADDKDRNRYRLEHALVRADGIGEWGRVLEDALTGPASQYLVIEARPEHAQLTQLCNMGQWQHASVTALKSALDHLALESEPVPVKTDMKRWFRLFATLRNKTRAHGATQPGKSAKAAEFLMRSTDLFYRNFGLFTKPWAYLHRNLSGKYRVSSITESSKPFEFLRCENTHSLPNGVYVAWSSPRRVPLIQSDPELQDFFFANGGLTGKSYELLSYFTDNKLSGDASEYITPPGSLQPYATIRSDAKRIPTNPSVTSRATKELV
jgi:hypothetical protein